LGDRIRSLLLSEAKHLSDYGSAGDLHKHNVIQTDFVVGIKESQAALDLVSPDHGLQDVLHGQDLAISEFSTSTVGSRYPVSDSQDGAQVVRRVAPLGSEPAVVVVEPSNHGTDVESAIDGVELERRTGDLSAIGNNGSLDDRAEELRALLEPEALQTATKGIEKDESSGVELPSQ
jgi:hypothetical protein